MQFPIFGGISDTVARVALSIWNSDPDLYFDVHNKFMNLGPRMKKDNIIDTLNELKLDGELIFAEAEKDIDNIGDTSTLAEPEVVEDLVKNAGK